MKVQEAFLSDGARTWLVLDEDYRPIAPVMKYLRYLGSLRRSPNTLRAYALDLKLYWEFLEQNLLGWENVSHDDLSDFVYWLQSGSTRVIPLRAQESARSERTINRILGTVSSFYEFHERSSDAPVLELTAQKRVIFKRYKGFLHHATKGSRSKQRIFKLKEPKRRPGALSSEQVKQLTEACTTLQQKFLLCLLYETGLRIGEALNLHHEDLESGGKNVVRVVNRPFHSSQVRNKSCHERTIDVSIDLMRLYSRYLIEEFPADEFSNYVFVRRSPKNPKLLEQLPYSTIQSLFRSLSHKTGIYVTAHLLRHTHATELIRANMNLAYVQNRMGHAQIQTTINTYTHLTRSDLNDAYRKFEEQRRGNDSSER